MKTRKGKDNSVDTTSGVYSSIDHPKHYGGDTVYEVIKVIEAWGLDKSFCLGNAIKYIARAKKKGRELEDLKKALWYLNREIARIENGKDVER